MASLILGAVMKRYLNTLFITTQKTYLRKELDTLIVKSPNAKTRLPLLNYESIVCFGNIIASPFLIAACMEKGINISFLSEYGKFLWRAQGKTHGNVVLRRAHYRLADDEEKSLSISKNMIIGKTANSLNVLDRAIRDHANKINSDKVVKVSEFLKTSIDNILSCQMADSLRGVEGDIARNYFSVFDEMILKQKDDFSFDGRNRRPPLDKVNAMLSFGYTLLHHNMVSALESVGLDSAVGFFHTDRSGRMSLAFDLMEEFRAFFVDRLVLTLINREQIRSSHFEQQGSGAVLLNDKGRKIFLNAFQEKKKEVITHPFINQKMHIGILFHIQAQLLARYIRGDIDEYPPYFW